MPSWNTVYDAFIASAQSIVTTTETVVATVSNVNTPGPGARVKLSGDIDITTGASTTAVTLRWRRGVDITGTLIGVADPITVTAGNAVPLHTDETDTPPELANATYVLTVQQTGAAANGSVTRASARVTV